MTRFASRTALFWLAVAALTLASCASTTAATAADPKIQAGASLVSGVLRVVVKALDGDLDPDQIDLDQLFVKSPTQLLEGKGMTQDEIDRIIRGE